MTKLLWVAALIATSLLSVQARAEDSAYCQKVHERAVADKILSLSPGVQLDALKYPEASSGSSVPFIGPVVGDGYQFRGSLTWDAMAAYRGTMMTGLADADCAYHSSQVEAQNLVEQAADIGRARALSAALFYLNDNRDEWRDIVEQVEKRVRAGNLTLSELTLIRTNAAVLEAKLVNVKGQFLTLEAKDYVKQHRSVEKIVQRLQATAMDLEHQISQMRMLDPWGLTVNGGAIPPMQSGTSVQWFGTVSLSYKFGGLVRGARENNYLSARQQELLHARYEMTDILRRIKDGVVASFNDSVNRIDALNRRLSELQQTRDELEAHPEARNAANLLALVNLQIMDARSDLVFVVELQKQLAAWK